MTDERLDAWLLLAILIANKKGGVSLDKIISAGDFIQHSILTFDEIKSGINRLMTNKLVRGVEDLITITPKARRLFTLNTKSRVLNDLDKIERILKSLKDYNKVSQTKHYILTKEQYELAIQKYKNEPLSEKLQGTELDN